VLVGTLCCGIASATTIASVGNPDPNFTPGLLVNEQEALSVSWTQTKSYTGVSISAPLGQGSADNANPVFGYLTNRVGVGTTPANQIAQSVVYFSPAANPTVQVFSDLTLGAGTYYLTLWSPLMAGGGWAFATDPAITVDAGARVGLSRYAYQYVGLDKNPFTGGPSGLYIPETIYADTYPNEHLVFTVTGTDATAIPEPQSTSLLAIFIASLSLFRFKSRRSRERGKSIGRDDSGDCQSLTR